MFLFSNSHITIATAADIAAITNLLNNSYRGEASKKGWTTEANLIAGDVRSDENNVKEVMEKPGSFFLIHTNDEHEIAGCVNLQQHGYKIYLGMFGVSPTMQGGGIGKQLLHAAEEFTLQSSCKVVYMTVISVRTELIDWYKRHGYIDTGERKAFIEDSLTGKHLQVLEFMVMEKILTG